MIRVLSVLRGDDTQRQGSTYCVFFTVRSHGPWAFQIILFSLRLIRLCVPTVGFACLACIVMLVIMFMFQCCTDDVSRLQSFSYLLILSLSAAWGLGVRATITLA